VSRAPRASQPRRLLAWLGPLPGRLTVRCGSRGGRRRCGGRGRRRGYPPCSYCARFCPFGTSMAWPSRAGPAGRPASASLHRRTAPRPGDVPPGSRPAPLRSAPGPGPGPGWALRSAARPVAAPGPTPLYDPAAGPSRARSATSRDPRIARRARGPPGVRCDAAGVWALRSSARPVPSWTAADLRAGSRAPAGPGLRCHVTHACAARAGPGGFAASPPADGGHVTVGGLGGTPPALPVRVAPVGPSVSVGVGADRCPTLGLSSPPGGPTTFGIYTRPQAKQVSSNESPVPGVPCHELSQ
jgi:hypothetical protein